MASIDENSRAARSSGSAGYGGSDPRQSRAGERGRAASSATSSTYDDVESLPPDDQVIRALRQIRATAATLTPRGSLAAHYGVEISRDDPERVQDDPPTAPRRPRYGGDHPLWRPPSDGGVDVEIRSQVSSTIHGSGYESDGGFDLVDDP